MGKEGGEGKAGVPGLTPVGGPGLIVIPPCAPHLGVPISHRFLQQYV